MVKEKYAERTKLWLKNHPDKVNEYSLKKYHKNKYKILPKQIRRINERMKTDLEFRKKREFRTLSRRLNGGKIIGKCLNCNSDKNLHRHYPDYNNPKEIVILCRRCHNLLHHNWKVVGYMP